MTMTGPLRVALIGHAFMGRAHSHGWRSVASFFEPPLTPELAVVCGRDQARVEAFAAQWGWAEAATDWRQVVERDDVDVVDICTPGSFHAEIAIAALEAGKHVLCEKPLANTVAEAEAMAAAAEKAAAGGVRSMVGFNYRRVPAVELARRLIADGRLGQIRHVRAAYLQDWLTDPAVPVSWRLRADQAGSGALGDIGSHVIDLAQHLTGQSVTGVSGLTETFVPSRPGGEVTVDDAALAVARLSGGAVATFEATRFALGRKNAARVEVNGSQGSVAFDLERLNELEFFDGAEAADTQGFRRVLVTEADHPWVGRWWPPGHTVGWEHTFTHEFRDLVEDIAAGRDPSPSFAEGLAVQRVLDAVVRSADTGRWTPLS
jgi:predicted dehydrogenase